jgi:hypothetical protein
MTVGDAVDPAELGPLPAYNARRIAELGAGLAAAAAEVAVGARSWGGRVERSGTRDV